MNFSQYENQFLQGLFFLQILTYKNETIKATASYAFSASGYSSYLIGYTSLNSEDGKTFQWIDGTKTDFTGWDRGKIVYRRNEPGKFTWLHTKCCGEATFSYQAIIFFICNVLRCNYFQSNQKFQI